MKIERKLDLKKLEAMNKTELIMLIAGIEGMTHMDVEDTIKTEVHVNKERISHQLYMEGYIQGGENFLYTMREIIYDLIDEGVTL